MDSKCFVSTHPDSHSRHMVGESVGSLVRAAACLAKTDTTPPCSSDREPRPGEYKTHTLLHNLKLSKQKLMKLAIQIPSRFVSLPSWKLHLQFEKDRVFIPSIVIFFPSCISNTLHTHFTDFCYLKRIDKYLLWIVTLFTLNNVFKDTLSQKLMLIVNTKQLCIFLLKWFIGWSTI